MMNLFYLLAMSHYYTGNYQNDIKNTCDFDVIRMKRYEINCNDYGEYIKYCHHYALPKQFIIIKEETDIQSNIIIKPEAMYEQNNYNYKMADFYYTFTCDSKYNSPQLMLHIVPTHSYDYDSRGIIMFVWMVSILPILVLIMYDNNC